MPPNSSPDTLVGKLLVMVKTLQFAWFVGHVLTSLSFSIYMLSRIIGFKSTFLYYLSYYGTIISYGITIYKLHGVPVISRAYLQTIMMDENTQYLMLAFIWLTSKPLWFTLVPFVIFSVFHTLIYTRTTVLPIFPPSPSFNLVRTLSSVIGNFITTNQSTALRAAAYWEIYIIFPLLILAIIPGYASFVSPFVFAQFLRFRYFFSHLTKEAVWDLDKRAKAWITDNSRCPQPVRVAWAKIREFIIKNDVETMMNQQSQQNQPPQTPRAD